jgi:hypothetical protein
LIAAGTALLARDAQIPARYTDSLAGVIAEETGAAATMPAVDHGQRPDRRPPSLIAYLREAAPALLEHVSAVTPRNTRVSARRVNNSSTA